MSFHFTSAQCCISYKHQLLALQCKTKWLVSIWNAIFGWNGLRPMPLPYQTQSRGLQRRSMDCFYMNETMVKNGLIVRYVLNFQKGLILNSLGMYFLCFNIFIFYKSLWHSCKLAEPYLPFRFHPAYLDVSSWKKSLIYVEF